MLTLEVKARDAKSSTEELRKSGATPAVFYGRGQEATAIAVNSQELEHVYREAGQTSVVTLQGLGEHVDALIHEVQFHPVTGKLLHIDFYVLEKGKKVTIEVPLEFEGVAPAEKAGHILVKTMHAIEIEVAPAELPHTLAVDLTKLANVGDRILAADIALPPSATLVTEGDEIVASITEFHEESAEIAPAPETIITTAKPEAAEAAEKKEE